jgi:hypothetical protein
MHAETVLKLQQYCTKLCYWLYLDVIVVAAQLASSCV